MATAARMRANEKYNRKTYEVVSFRVKKGEKVKIIAHADSKGLSLNAYLNGLVNADMGKI